MATKRTPINRDLRVRITPEAITLFTRCEELSYVYFDCLSSDITCLSTDPATHCKACAEYLDASTRINQLLAIKPWQYGPTEVDSEQPPPWLHEPLKISGWQRAWELRQALQEAARGAVVAK